MVLKNFKDMLSELEDALVKAAYYNINLNDKPAINIGQKPNYPYASIIERSIRYIGNRQWELLHLSVIDSNKPRLIEAMPLINSLLIAYKACDIRAMLSNIKRLEPIIRQLKPIEDKSISFNLRCAVPAAVKHDIDADLSEITKCYAAQCYRSAIILCGRILEVALHRKYYEMTGMDILEKNPGIGLGTLVAKLSEKSLKLDPGITQQIHLINQARIFSVHKQQLAFYPTKNQAYAIILFTTDTLNKLFKK